MQQNNIAFLNYQNNNQIYLQQVPYIKNLSSTRTIYHNYIPSYAKAIKAKNYSDYSIYATIPLLLGIIIFTNGFSIIALPVSFILIALSIFLIIRGFKRYEIYNILVNTPVSKIHIATYGLDKVKGRFIPYKSQPLKTPISGQDCIYYSISIWYTYLESDGNRTYVRFRFVDGFDVGIPALFTDGTGFLAVDLEKASNIEVRANIIDIQPHNLQNHIWKSTKIDVKKISDEVLQYIKDAASKNIQIDLSYIKNYDFKLWNSGTRNLKMYPGGYELIFPEINKGTKGKRNLIKHPAPGRIYLIEQYIPINEDYTIIGGFADTGEMIDMKPVKVTVPDMSTGILWLSITRIFGREFIGWGALDIFFGIGYLILTIWILTKFLL
ncbi:MAG: hypothetical protein RXN31_00590 [Candidatus Nanopusillus acidilobi]